MRPVSAGQAAGPFAVILALGTTQTIAWASSYYLPAILAAPIARDLGLAPTHVFGALSGALVIAGLLGPRVGHAIDTFGGRGLLATSNLVFAAGLLVLSVAQGPVLLIAAWVLLGIGMGMGLYEAAFATLARIYGANARRSITGITLIAGFASTLGWPLSTWLDSIVRRGAGQCASAEAEILRSRRHTGHIGCRRSFPRRSATAWRKRQATPQNWWLSSHRNPTGDAIGAAAPAICTMAPGPACLRCVGLDGLEYLPAGDALLTRRAKAKSTQYAVVVRFSRTRRRYERQGLLVEPQALADAQ
jgi:hypothetical protein